MSHALIHLILTWGHHVPQAHSHWYQSWFNLNIGNGCGAIHSGNWSC